MRGECPDDEEKVAVVVAGNVSSATSASRCHLLRRQSVLLSDWPPIPVTLGKRGSKSKPAAAMGNQASVKNHLENASRTGVFQLSGSNVSEFPKDVVRIKDTVRSLDLSKNKLKVIPDYLGTFVNLKHLNLNDNKVGTMPSSIGDLSKLESLSIRNNMLVTVPRSLESLTHLRSVDLSGNHITSFPKQFCNLKHLDMIDLSRNKITEIPDGVDGLQVSELNLNQNQISKISDSIASCPRLKVLRLDENCLPASGIPKKLLTDSPVSLISVEGNLFEATDFQQQPGYDVYQERFTATKKKLM